MRGTRHVGMWWRSARLSVALVALIVWAHGCSPAGMPGGDNGGNGGNGGSGNGGSTPTDVALRVSFEAGGGNYAVAEDDKGNEYAFRAREGGDGQLSVTETTIRLANGNTVKISLDGEGRPVNFRSGNNANADVVYGADASDVRYTNADGEVVEGGAQRSVSISSAQSLTGSGGDASDNLAKLRAALAAYEREIAGLFDDADTSPLADSEFAEGALTIALIAGDADLEEVTREELVNAVLDETPPVIQQLAGQTFVLFDAEGICLPQTGAINRLSFDLDGVLQSEFDRNVVFPDFGVAQSRDSGVTINYSTGSPVNLTPGAGDFTVFVTPVFTATSVDDNDLIVVERRFVVDSSFTIDTFAGATAATAQQLFDAALIGGTLSEDGTLLEFELTLVDLRNENPVRRIGALRYVNQNASAPSPLFNCDVITAIDDSDSGINCPLVADVSVPFTLDYLFGRSDDGRDLTFEWFVSDGVGFVNSDPFQSSVDVLPLASGIVQVSLIVSDVTDGDAGIYRQYSCETLVGEPFVDVDPSFLSVSCPVGLNVGEPGGFRVTGSAFATLALPEWFVIGSRAFTVSDPFADYTEITFLQPGRFSVAFSGFDATGNENFVECEVLVGSSTYDLCEINGYYDDGICDEFCAKPDGDCDSFYDPCEINGFYDDGICDAFCPYEDGDCAIDSNDLCEDAGFYGDGSCDLFCLFPDPDCGTYDVCAQYGLYSDGKCDFCPVPDPDCDDLVDYCSERGWYGDGECDTFCPQPDPDCDQFDVCGLLLWYDDGTCDDFCLYPDPDCDGVSDICALESRYGDGICDDDCPLPDVDCEDECAVNGFYGDGTCDSFCLYADPDCAAEDECATLGFYADGFCDAFCLHPDPDCEGLDNLDQCDANGWYGDGECDTFCPLPDPDCGQQ